MQKRYHETTSLGYNERYCFLGPEGQLIVKPVNLNQLLFHQKGPCISFFVAPVVKEESETSWEAFFNDMIDQLILQDRHELVKLMAKSKNAVRKVMKTHPEKCHGFFISETVQGFTSLGNTVEPYCTFGTRFHVRPLMEEVLVNPEFILVNVSLYDIKVYKADFRHVEILQHYEFDQFTNKDLGGIPRVFAPEFMGVIPYKSVLAIRAIAKKVMEITLYDSLPVVVTGLDQMKKLFIKHFNDDVAVITHFDEDFYEKTCVEILSKCRVIRPAIMDFYSAQLKERLKRMLKSRKIVTDLEIIVKNVSEGNVIHLVLPVESKIWGKIDLEKGTFELHKKLSKKNMSVDILNELAEEVMRQGGKIQFLGPHFFPENSQVFAVLKGA